jgi:hypothetical protein
MDWTIKIPVLFRMDNLTIYQLRTADEQITYLIEDGNEFHLTTDFPVILGIIQKHVNKIM